MGFGGIEGRKEGRGGLGGVFCVGLFSFYLLKGKRREAVMG